MGFIAMGAVAFVFAGLFDIAALRGWRFVKQVSGLVAALLFSYAAIMLALHPDKLQIPIVLRYVGWTLLVISGFLLIYSLFLELPLRQTYAADGTGDRLVKSGTYALVRHPGVLWLALLLVSIVLVSRSRLMVWAVPIWLGLDVLLVWFEEQFTLPCQFPEYVEYQQETPMLIPTLGSVRRCWYTFRDLTAIEKEGIE